MQHRDANTSSTTTLLTAADAAQQLNGNSLLCVVLSILLDPHTPVLASRSLLPALILVRAQRAHIIFGTHLQQEGSKVACNQESGHTSHLSGQQYAAVLF